MFNTLVFETLPKYESFKWWFVRKGAEEWAVISRDGSSQLALVYSESRDIIISGPEILSDDLGIRADFERFKQRPEYQLGRPINLCELNGESIITHYEMLLAAITMIRAQQAGSNPDNAFPAFEKNCLDWLRGTDMYTAPASTQYHESFAGGLLAHTLKVYNKAMELCELKSFSKVSRDSAALAALTHDWCKIFLYERYLKNVKNEATNKWEKVEAWRHNQKSIPLGHGVSSMYLAGRSFRLSQEESLAIRWHMGWCRVADSDMNELELSNESFPLVQLVQFADQLSITNYANWELVCPAKPTEEVK